MDVWQLSDGDSVTLTNRIADLPSDFELHPLETKGSLAYWMMSRIKEGYQPGEPVDGPNLWRVLAGDVLVWGGAQRPGASGTEGVLEVVIFVEEALVYGEPIRMAGPFPAFGGFAEELKPDQQDAVARTMSVLRTLDPPRTLSFDEEWKLG